MLPITPVIYTSVSTTWAAKVTCLFDISTGWDIKRGAIRVELIIGKVSFQISVEVSDIFWRLSFLLYAIIDRYFTRVYLIQSMNLQTMSNILELFRSQAEISKARCCNDSSETSLFIMNHSRGPQSLISSNRRISPRSPILFVSSLQK